MKNLKDNCKIIYQADPRFGGHLVYCSADDSYEGPFEIVATDSFDDSHLGILPTRKEAFAVARYSVSPDGGYSEVTVIPAPDCSPTDLTLEDWICK